MESKITFSLFYMGLISAIIAVALAAFTFHNSYQDNVKETLYHQTKAVAYSYQFMDHPQQQLGELKIKNFRLTIFCSNGSILYDSNTHVDTPKNYEQYPEVKQAQAHGMGYRIERSKTMIKDFHYYAVRLDDGNILRVSIEADSMLGTLWNASPVLIGILLTLLLLAVLFSIMLTRKLVKPIKVLTQNINNPILIEDEDSIYTEFVPFIHEIQHQRKQIQEQLSQLMEEKNKLTTIIEQMTEGMILLDQEMKILLVNHSALTYLEAEHNPHAKHLLFLSHNPDLIDLIHRAIHGNSESKVISMKHKQIQILTNPVYSEGSQIGVICLMLDVTEREQMNQFREEFTANVSHELKTPLTSISGYAEMIESGIAKQEDIVRFASVIQKEAARLLTLISDIIQLSELDESSLETVMESVDLYEITKDCYQVLEPVAQRKHLSFLLTGDKTMVKGNRQLLWELVYNLCDNAIRYTPSEGEVCIMVADNTVTVSDTGIGIPKEQQSRIFERFYRVDKSRSKETGGTGLGLSIVKHIAEQHQAEILLQSKENYGTTISIHFTQI